MGSTDAQAKPRRFFVGVGVGEYDDPALNLPRAVSDVIEVADWFTHRSGAEHEAALPELGRNPQAVEILSRLRAFLADRDEDDVVVIYAACHGELEGARVHLFGRDTPRQAMAGLSVDAATLGAILGQSPPHRVLLILDACVAGRLGAAVQRAAEDASDELNNRDPHRPYALVVVSSTYGRDPALDGRFAKAFLRVVGEERWTGTSSAWINVEQLMDGLNEELRDVAPSQVAELRLQARGPVELIPNPHYATRALGGLIAPDELAAHFDPSSRWALPGEAGSFFTGRTAELDRITGWLQADGHEPLLVITGSPGAGKSALLSHAVVADEAGAFDGVVWCHNKSDHEVVGELAAILDGTANSPEELVRLSRSRTVTIAVDALDEAAGGSAQTIARDILRPLARVGGARLLLATRRQSVHGRPDARSLLDEVGATAAELIDLDAAPERHADVRAAVLRRLSAVAETAGADAEAAAARLEALADRIVEAAGDSFLVAAIAARSVVAAVALPDDLNAFELPGEVGDALSAYLDRLPDPDLARDVLRPLAWAFGAGLPWGPLWPRLASVLADGRDYGDDDVREVLETAGDLIVESADAGQPVYRLFHEALAEHLRGATAGAAAHAAIAGVLRDHARDRPWTQIRRYARAHLPTHLLLAGQHDAQLEILLDPTWERARREEAGDPLAAVGQAQSAIDALLEADPTDLRAVPLCAAYSRAMATAAPLVIEVIARSGQLARAEAMANNLTYAVDRILAYRQLAGAYAEEGDRSAAARCVDETERSLATVPPTHRPMAWYSVAFAAVDAGLPDRAARATTAAVDEAFGLEEGGWDRPNGLFWAAMAARLVGDGTALAHIREDIGDEGFRNQTLQAASVAGNRDLLLRHLAVMGTGARYPGSPVRDGNLALALADAGMHDEAAELFRIVGDDGPSGEPDANKRYAWALALTGRMTDAATALRHIGDPIETSKAIARIAVVARDRGDQDTLDTLVPEALDLLDVEDARLRARLIRVLWLAGRHEEALTRAEAEVGHGYVPAMIADPRDGGEPPGLDRLGPPGTKSGRRELPTSVVPVADEQWSRDAEDRARRGDIDGAVEQVGQITVPQFRARALAALARHHPDPGQRLVSWLAALVSARPAGRGAIDEVLSLGAEVLAANGREDEYAALSEQLTALDKRWELESFAEQYETLRRTLPSGTDRTRRMTGLIVVARRLAQSQPWTSDELRAAWRSGDEGKRLFAVVVGGAGAADILVEGIRASRSGFEQYHALRVALDADLSGLAADAVKAAVAAEVRGDTRPDGSRADLADDGARMGLAKRLLARS